MTTKVIKRTKKKKVTSAPADDGVKRIPAKSAVTTDTVMRPEIYDVHDHRLLLPRFLIAQAFGVSRDASSKWNLRAVAKRKTEKLFYLPEAVQIRLGNGDGVKLDPSQEKAKLDRLRAEKAEIELQKTKGDVVDISDVCAEIEKELVAVRQRMLAIPNKLATSILLAKDPSEAQDMIEASIVEALEDMTYGGRISFESEEADSANAKAASKTKRS